MIGKPIGCEPCNWPDCGCQFSPARAAIGDEVLIRQLRDFATEFAIDNKTDCKQHVCWKAADRLMHDVAQPTPDLSDWSSLPRDLYVTSVKSDGVVFDVQCCSVPMAIGPELRYSQAHNGLSAGSTRQVRPELNLLTIGNTATADRSADSAREALAALYPFMDSLEAFRGEKDVLRISGPVGDAQDVGIASIETTRKAIEATVKVLEGVRDEPQAVVTRGWQNEKPEAVEYRRGFRAGWDEAVRISSALSRPNRESGE